MYVNLLNKWHTAAKQQTKNNCRMQFVKPCELEYNYQWQGIATNSNAVFRMQTGMLITTCRQKK
jgi:hypothetical protein